MTNNEILRASVLDILFEGRNKEYGAYALRKEYNQRLLWGLGSGLCLVFGLMLISGMKRNDSKPNEKTPLEEVIVSSFELPEIKEQELPQPRQQRPPEAVSTVQYTTPRIVDELQESEMPDRTAVDENAIGKENSEGEKPGNVVTLATGPSGNQEPVTEPVAPPEPPKPSSAPEFPGGMDALREFLIRHLVTPDNLDVGEKKIVKARFFVDKDGSVSTIEIELSGGKVFDKEVMRVCKKMPKWKPALQNGMPVKVSYVLPVTFIGIEQ
jgi:periplasmic protein TonB